mmetsp:Transcript_10084/g.25587  ORF Transcript_10084/g.25587 Transcript_10084/m.25587 type:complete len:147 (+) Transcript_10084:597-1037(+)
MKVIEYSVIPPNAERDAVLRKQLPGGTMRGIFVGLTGHSVGDRKPHEAPTKVSGREIPNHRNAMYSNVRNGTAPDEPSVHSTRSIRKNAVKATPGTSRATPRTSVLRVWPDAKLPYSLPAVRPPTRAKHAYTTNEYVRKAPRLDGL